MSAEAMEHYDRIAQLEAQALRDAHTIATLTAEKAALCEKLARAQKDRNYQSERRIQLAKNLSIAEHALQDMETLEQRIAALEQKSMLSQPLWPVKRKTVPIARDPRTEEGGE